MIAKYCSQTLSRTQHVREEGRGLKEGSGIKQPTHAVDLEQLCFYCSSFRCKIASRYVLHMHSTSEWGLCGGQRPSKP